MLGILEIRPVKIHPERITREDKKIVNSLNLARLKKRTTYALTCFVMKAS